VDINTQFLKHILSDISISSLSETEPESEDEREAFMKKYNVRLHVFPWPTTDP
jgi:hypothetical protein